MTSHSCRKMRNAQSGLISGRHTYFIESTYLVPAGSTINSIEEVNRPGCRIIAISNTTTARSARRTAPNANVEEVPSVDRMTEMARQGEGDAFALSHELIRRTAPQASWRSRVVGKFPADWHRSRSAERTTVCAEDCERIARNCEDVRSGASCARRCRISPRLRSRGNASTTFKTLQRHCRWCPARPLHALRRLPPVKMSAVLCG